MKVKFGSLVTRGTGKLGGHVFQGNNGHLVMRNKTFRYKFSPTNNRSIAKGLPVAAQRWRSLSPSIRTLYLKFSKLITKQDGSIPSAFETYVSMSSLWFPLDPTSAYVSPGKPSLVPPLNPVISLSKSTFNFSVNYTKDANNPLHILLYASRPCPRGLKICTNSIKLVTFWYSVQNPPFNFYSAYLNFIASSVDVGSYVRIKAVFFWNSNPFLPYIIDKVYQVV